MKSPRNSFQGLENQDAVKGTQVLASMAEAARGLTRDMAMVMGDRHHYRDTVLRMKTAFAFW